MSSFYYVCVADAGIGVRLLAGCTTGAMAVAIAQPTDVVKVRFQAHMHMHESGTMKRYSSTIDAYKTIARDEGVKGLWKGNRRLLLCIITILGPHRQWGRLQ